MCVCVCVTALDAALEFLQQLVVPSAWKTEVKEESSSSEDEDEEEEEGQEEDASEKEEEEVEAEPLHTLLIPTISHLQKKKTLKLCCFLSAGGGGAIP